MTRAGLLMLLVGALSAVDSVVASAQPAAAAPPARPLVGQPRPFVPAARQEAKLPNGLQLVVARHGSVPKITAALVAKGAGLAGDPTGRAGLAAYTTDALLEGTTTRTSEQLRREAFGMGGSLTTVSGQDYSMVQVRGLSEYLPDLLALLADVVVNPRFPEDELAALKTRQLQALQQQRASPQFLSNREFRRSLFREHPYSRITAEEADLKSLDRPALVEFHAVRYQPGQATLIVVGDVQPDAAIKAAERAFGSWKRTETKLAAVPPAQPVTGRTLVFVQRPNSVQSSISVGNLSIKRSDPRWYGVSVTNTLLGGSFNSRLVRKLREEKGYTYSPQSQFSAFGEAGFYRFAADVRSEVTGPALDELFQEIDRLIASGAEEQELADIKQYMRGLYAIRMAAQTQLAGELVTVYLYDLPKDYLETYQAKITAVASADVKASAQALVSPANSVISIVGDWNKVKDQLNGYGKVSFVDPEGKALPEAPAE
jgi:zinc protease